MRVYQMYYKFCLTEKRAKEFCDCENQDGSYYKRKKYPAFYTKWESKSDNTAHYVCFYWR